MAKAEFVIKTRDEVTKVIENVTNNFKKIEGLLQENADMMKEVIKNGVEVVKDDSLAGE